MEIKKVTAIYFSPTGGTKNYVKKFCEALCLPFTEINLTLPNARKQQYCFGPTELAVIGAPVYAGRLPQLYGETLFSNLKADKTPAVIIVSYGNREFEDALLELKNVCEKQGFIAASAAAVIAPHTYSEKAGKGRPNLEDGEFIKLMAARTKEKLKTAKEVKTALTVPGHYPYKEFKKHGFCPTANNNCTSCGICACVCPVDAINKSTPKLTNKEKCIACFACVKQCPEKARAIRSVIFKVFLKILEPRLTKEIKKPQAFI